MFSRRDADCETRIGARRMKIEVQHDDEAVARNGAAIIAADARAAVPARGRFIMAMSDGHTASLVPGDPVLDVTDADVAITGPYQGRRRMTLTFPIINRSLRVLWLVTGGEKAGTLMRLRDGDPSIPASRVRQDRALVLADRAAAERLGTT